jgi:uncharacterized protein (DUF58 family)
VESGDLFGIYEQACPVGPAEHLTVYPALAPLSEAGLPADDPFGERRSRRRLFEDPNRPMGIRAYQPEDSFRRIHWPATARTGHLQTAFSNPSPRAPGDWPERGYQAADLAGLFASCSSTW